MAFLRCLSLLALFWIPFISAAQQKTYLGINITPLVVNTIDFRFERHLNNYVALQAGTGFRIQSRDTLSMAQRGFFENYVQLRNHGGFLSIGARIFDRQSTEYPYAAFDIVGVYYNERIRGNDTIGNTSILDVSGMKGGATLTVGMVTELLQRLHIDVGIQFGFSPQRKDLNSYYLTGMGYSTFGFGILGIKGGHLQPVVTLKYNLFKDPRDRIREMD